MTDQKEEQKTQPNPEQVARMKAAMLKGYNDNMEFLETQVKYEELQARLSEAIARQARAEAMIAQIRFAGDQEPETKSEENAPKEATMTATRTLKKETNANQ